MITTDFSRTFLREGYDMSEVRAFLADVERTIRGQVSEADQIVTAQKAEEIEFSVKFRGFNMDQVDAEIERLIGVLRGLDREREWAAQHEDEVGEGARPGAARPRLVDRSAQRPRGARGSSRSFTGAHLRYPADHPRDAPSRFWRRGGVPTAARSAGRPRVGR